MEGFELDHAELKQDTVEALTFHTITLNQIIQN